MHLSDSRNIRPAYEFSVSIVYPVTPGSLVLPSSSNSPRIAHLSMIDRPCSSEIKSQISSLKSKFENTESND